MLQWVVRKRPRGECAFGEDIEGGIEPALSLREVLNRGEGGVERLWIAEPKMEVFVVVGVEIAGIFQHGGASASGALRGF
jgi:hypothetical protein